MPVLRNKLKSWNSFSKRMSKGENELKRHTLALGGLQVKKTKRTNIKQIFLSLNLHNEFDFGVALQPVILLARKYNF